MGRGWEGRSQVGEVEGGKKRKKRGVWGGERKRQGCYLPHGHEQHRRMSAFSYASFSSPSLGGVVCQQHPVRPHRPHSTQSPSSPQTPQHLSVGSQRPQHTHPPFSPSGPATAQRPQHLRCSFSFFSFSSFSPQQLTPAASPHLLQHLANWHDAARP